MTNEDCVSPQYAESVLIIDDSRVQRMHAATLCAQLGITQVYEASNGAEALDVIASLPELPGVLIVDLEMPGMNGVELIQNLGKRGLRIPVIVASSREGSLIHAVETMTKALGMELLGGLSKPLSREQLAAALCCPGSRTPAVAESPAMEISLAELSAAIRDGAVQPYYQPKLDVRTGIIRGVEALARWIRPDQALVEPGSFIPLAEENGLIEALTYSIAEQACAQAAKWNAQGLRVSMAINLSPRQLTSETFVDDVTRLIERHAIRADQIVWEVTESSVVENLGEALGVLARLRLQGFGLSIDDYGTGFSSMQQLARIPFTELKVDRSFVNGASQREHLRVILQSALEMANRLNLVTVAEGVEDIEDWALLQDYGCVLAQGYLIAKPMPGDELPVWLRTHSRHLRSLRGPRGAGQTPEPSVS